MSKKYRYFSKKDNFGDFTKMDEEYLTCKDRARHVIKQTNVVHCGFEEGNHAPASRHAHIRCDASDHHYGNILQGYKINSKDMGILHRNLDHLILDQRPRSILRMIILTYLSGMRRIGIYTFGKPRTFFHTDRKKGKTDFWIGLTLNKLLNKIARVLDIPASELQFIKDKAIKRKVSQIYIYPK